MARDLNLSVTLSAINKATGPLRKIMQGSKGAGGAIRETRDHLRNLQDQQKKLSSFKKLSGQSYETRDALRDKREELRKITSQLETTEGPTRRLTQQQEKAQREVDKLSGEYRQQRDKVRELARELPAGTEGTRGFKEQNAALEEQIRKTNERLGKQQDALRRLGNADVGGKFRNMTSEVGRFGRNVALVGGLAAGSIFGLANSTADLGDDVGKTAAKLGLTNAELQEYRYAGERSGVATETLDSSMVAFTKRLGEAAEGTGAAAKGYEALGLDAQALADMPVADAMDQVADAMAEIENPTRRNAIAAQLYSRAGVGLVNMLKDGSRGLGELGSNAHDVGYVLSEEATGGSEDFKDAMLDAQTSMKGMKNTIGAELMPAVAELMREFTGWMRQNRDEVQAFAREFGEKLKDALPVIVDLAKGAGNFASTLADLTARAAEMAGGFDNLAMIIGGLFAAKAITSVIMFGVAIAKAGAAIGSFAMTFPAVAAGVKALSAAFAATPIGWIVAGIAAVAGAAYLIYKHWEPIKAFFSDLWQQANDAFDEGLSGIGRLLVNWSPFGLLWAGISSALERLGVDLPDSLSELGGSIISGLVNGIKAGWSALRETVSEMATNVGNWFKEVLGINSPSRVFEGFGGNIVDGIINGIGAMGGALRDHVVGLASDIAGWMGDTVGNAVDVGKDIANGLGDGISNGAGWAWSKVKELTGGAEDTAREDLDTHSPSRVFRSIGSDVAKGLGIGIEGDADGPLKQVRQLTSQLRNAGAGLLLGAGVATTAAGDMGIQGVNAGTGANIDTSPIQLDNRPPLQSHTSAGGDVHITMGDIVINPAPGMDEQALARLVNEQVQRALREATRQAAAAQRRNFHDND